MKTRSIILLVAMLFVVVLAATSCSLFHQHTWQDATCTTPKTCTECGVTVGEALGHAEEVLEGKDATCAETGLTEGKKCSACGEILVKQETIPTTAHTEETVAGKAATCTATGLTEGKKCSVCDTVLVEQEEIPMKAHTPETVAGKEATCTATGLTDGKKCSDCGAILEAQKEIPLKAHAYDEGWDPDCNVCGTVRTCAHDGEKIALTGKAATCTATGLTDGEKCGICGDITKAQEIIKALDHDMSEATCTAASKCQREGCDHVEGEPLDHDYDEGVITTKPGCETKGVKTFTCKREGCGHSYTVDVEPTKHDYKETVVASTCIAQGYTLYTCGNCGNSYKDNYTALAEHTYNEGVITTNPTCLDKGVKTYTCTVEGCGKTKTEEISANGHAEIQHAGQEATCTEDGWKAYVTCENCSYTTYEKINKTGHKGGTATCKDLAVCSACGEKYGTLDKVNGHHYGEASCDAPATCILCGETSGSAIGHADKTPVDHKCDRCGETLTECVDDNNDHACDNGCDKFFGECVDNNFDHKCDYGCGKSDFGTCADADKDHDCDYGCDKYFDVHADGDDKGHLCDYCGEFVDTEVCVDTNKNHICDECDARVGGDCQDDKNGQDADHNCDYCGASVGEACYGGTPTCTEKAVCSECGQSYGEFAAHVYNKTNAVDKALKSSATCTALAVYYKSCVCGEVDKSEGAETFEYGEYAPHTEVSVPGKDATCTATGLTEGTKCEKCGKTLVEQEEIPMAEHTKETLKGYAATCTEEGLTDGVICTVCKATLTKQETISALGHDWADATCDTAKTCKRENCGITEGDPLGHKYNVTYTWSEDNSTCTANGVCEHDASHTFNEIATVTSVKLNVSASKITYTYNVEFENNIDAYTKSVEADVTLENGIATVNAPAIAGRVASHDYVKFGFYNVEATYEFTIYYSEVDVWDGTSVSESLQGSGTLEDPYLIQSAADFAYLAAQLNNAEVGQAQNFEGQYFKMTKSIDLNGNLLIAGNHSGWNMYQGFGGTFDGNNCSIRGINVEPTTGKSAALFGCITKAGTLKNLIVYGNAKGTETVGGVVAYQLGAVDNVTSYVTVTATAGTIGGVVANQEGSAGVLSNSVNYGSVTTTSYIAGGVAGSGGATIINCVNWGNVQGGNESIGGIAGTTKDKGTISGCYNYGDVKTTAGDKGMIGGIAGKAVKPINNCYNYGTITGANTTGGIAGSTTKAITNCYNYGAVNATSWNIGGIVGSTDANISDCTNYGDITSTADCVGGIAGSSKATISGCTNYGTVKGIGRSAGIVYYSNGTIENCINNGDVIGGWDLGGILAWVGDGQSATIKNCTNNGNVTGTWNNGGIFGLAHDNAGTVTITGCTNNGKINSYTGGQITIAVKAVITDCTENGSYVVLHELTHVNAVAPTCDADGNVAYDNCSVCGKNFDAEGNELNSVKLPAGHKDEGGDGKCDACGTSMCDHVSEIVKENEKAATCTAAGSYDNVEKCTKCGEELGRETVTVDALGHKMTSAVEGTKKTYTCENGCGLTEIKYLVTVNHLNLDGTVAAEAEVYEYDNNYIYTINAKTIEGYVASHDYVKGHILSTGGTVNIYYSQVDVWDGTSVSESLSGTGTEDDPYLIQSAADFAYFASVINSATVGTTQNFEGQYIKMTKSVDLNNSNLMIGSHSAWNKYQGFGGVLDGNNCSVRNVNVSPASGSAGLFGCITDKGTLKNLSVYGSVTGTGIAGGVVAYVRGNVDNVTSYVTVNGAGTVGGIGADVANIASRYISNCTNYGNVTGTGTNVGGIAGSGGGQFTNCANFGAVSGGNYTGGICGTTKNIGTFSGCNNYATVNGANYVGGIAGKCLKTVENSANYGEISATGSASGDIYGTNK